MHVPESPIHQSATSFTARAYGRGGGVGRPLGNGLDLGVGVGRGVDVGVGVGVEVAVAVAVALGVGVGVVSDWAGAWMSTEIGDPVLKNPMFAMLAAGGALESNRKLYNVPKRIAFAF